MEYQYRIKQTIYPWYLIIKDISRRGSIAKANQRIWLVQLSLKHQKYGRMIMIQDINQMLQSTTNNKGKYKIIYNSFIYLSEAISTYFIRVSTLSYYYFLTGIEFLDYLCSILYVQCLNCFLDFRNWIRIINKCQCWKSMIVYAKIIIFNSIYYFYWSILAKEDVPGT